MTDWTTICTCDEDEAQTENTYSLYEAKNDAAIVVGDNKIQIDERTENFCWTSERGEDKR